MNNPIVAITWEEPPVASMKRASKWDDIADALKANPGRWAKVGECKAASYVGGLKKRGVFEIKYISAGLGYKQNRNDIYARFVGGSND